MKYIKIVFRSLLPVFICLLAVPINSCDYNYGLQNSDYDVIITNFEKNFNFKSITKFTINDSIVNLNDTTQFMKDPAKTEFINTLKTNMQNRGFIYVPPSDTTAQAIFTNAFTTKDYEGYYYPDYDPWFPWGYYDWFYPGYFADYYQFSVGTVFIHLAVKTGTPKKIKVEWTAVANGYIQNNNDYSRLPDAINKAFTQSPYLSK